MIETLKNINEVNIICPKKRIYQFYIYSRYLMNVKKINFSKKNINCNFYLIDQENIDFVKKNKNNKAKFIIFFWNGYFDYIKYLNDKEIENDNNISLIVIGNIGHINSPQLNLINLNNNSKINGLSLFRYLDLKFTFLSTVTKVLINPLFTIKNVCFNKLIFIGSGLIKPTSDFSHLLKNHFALSEILKDYKLLINMSDKEQFFEKIYMNSKFKFLKNFEKYYFLQLIFRDIILSKLSKFKNFKLFENDKNLSIQRSFLFKKNFFLDLGSKVGSEKYYERAITYEIYKKKNLIINFFKNNNINSNTFEEKNKLMIKFIKNINNIIDLDISGKDLVYNINNFYLKLVQNETF